MLQFRSIVGLLFLIFLASQLHAGPTNPDSLLNVEIQNASQLFNSDARAALQILERAEKAAFFEKAGCATRAMFFHRKGVCYFRLKEYATALTYFRDQALPMREQCLGKTHVETANTTYNVAIMYRNLGDRNEEARYLRKSIAILENLPQETTVLTYLTRNYKETAELLRSQGDLATAKRYLSSARQLMERQGSFTGKDKAFWDYRWGILQADLKNYPEAMSAYKNALTAYSALDPVLYQAEIAHCYQEIGVLYVYHQPNLTQAEQYARKALALYEKIPGETSNLSLSYELLGIIDKRKKRYNAALKSLNRALTLRESIHHEQLIANAWENIGDVYGAMGNTAKAMQCYVKGAKSPVRLDAIRAGILRADLLKKEGTTGGRSQALQDAMLLYLQIDSIATELRLFYKDNDSKTALLAERSRFYENAIETAHSLFARTRDTAWLETAYRFCSKNKAVLLMDGIHDLEAKGATLPDSVRAQEQTMRRHCLELLAAGAPSFNAERIRYQHFIDNLEAQYPAYFRLKYQDARPISIDELQRRLGGQAVLLEYFKGERHVYTFLITKDKPLQMFVATTPKQLDEVCRQFRAIVENTRGEYTFADYPGPANQLYGVLLEQALPNIPPAVTRIGIVPDGSLANLPFDLLPTQRVSTWEGLKSPLLIKRFALSQAFSSQWLLYHRSDNTAKIKALKTFGGFGLEYDDVTLRALLETDEGRDTALLKRNIGKLYYSDDEVRESALVFEGGDAWLNQEATKKHFLENYGQYAILHFAMHGLLDPANPLKSSLVFSCSDKRADFKLLLPEIFGLQIQAQLAVLSACNTYSGPSIPGEGLNSLALAFAHAGCPAILANQWSASDQSSKTILLQFYKHLRAGLPKDVALRQAKLDYLEQSMPTFSMPGYWANLVAIGDMAPLFDADEESVDNQPVSGTSWRWGFMGILGILGVWGIWKWRRRNIS